MAKLIRNTLWALVLIASLMGTVNASEPSAVGDSITSIMGSKPTGVSLTLVDSVGDRLSLGWTALIANDGKLPATPLTDDGRQLIQEIGLSRVGQTKEGGQLLLLLVSQQDVTYDDVTLSKLSLNNLPVPKPGTEIGSGLRLPSISGLLPCPKGQALGRDLLPTEQVPEVRVATL